MMHTITSRVRVFRPIRRGVATLLLCTSLGANVSAEPIGGQPPAGSKQSVVNLDAQVAYHRAFEATLWAMPALAIYRFRVGFLQLPGMADNVICAYSGPLRTNAEAITPNQTTPYIVAVSDLRKGPTVVVVPAKSAKASIYGQVVDAWQATIAEVGPGGSDNGAGGKYLFLPPGFKGSVPTGYFVIHSPSYRIAIGFRSIAAPGEGAAVAYAYSKTLKMYPYSEANAPVATRFVDGLHYPLHTLPFYDIRTLQDIHDIISVEPVQPRDKVMMGMLATIGIAPGKPFNPPPALKASLQQGVIDAYHYMQDLDTKLFATHLYWPDRHWSFVMVPDEQHGFQFVSHDAVEIDRRAAAWFFYTFYPRVLTNNAATVYLAPIADRTGQPLQAGKTYRIRVPKDVPARQFWSLTVYDRANWSFIDNPLDRAGLGSLDKSSMKLNEDGSVDLYFGPTAPTGMESNWIPTMGKEPYVWLRLYGPAAAFWNKTFKMPDAELVR